MRIAVASGKGGTGKTTLSVTMAQAYDGPVSYLDCDVEEPNGCIFLKPDNVLETPVEVLVPVVDEKRCTGCGKCASVCLFNAMITMCGKVIVFPEMCHSCGGCEMICPEKAITEQGNPIGSMSLGTSGHIKTVQGLLDIGFAMAPPVIRAVKKHIGEDRLNIIDCPPGTSCPMIAAVKGADFVILVTEPTPFGLHDLKLAVETMRELKIPFGVVINRSDSGDNRVVEYCEKEETQLLLQIPESRKIAVAYSRGESILDAEPGLKEELQTLLAELIGQYGGSA
jgi:MinD superfamily P-loop ATPase